MTPTTYRTRPAQVEAMQLTDLDSARAIRDWMTKPHIRAADTGASCLIVSPETARLHLNLCLDNPGGRGQAYPGNWVVKDEHSEWHVLTNAEFTAAYEPAQQVAASTADTSATEDDDTEKPIGDLLDALGITAAIEEGALISSALVLLRVLQPDGQVRLSQAHSEGVNFLDRIGMLRVAETVETARLVSHRLPGT